MCRQDITLVIRFQGDLRSKSIQCFMLFFRHHMPTTYSNHGDKAYQYLIKMQIVLPVKNLNAHKVLA